jgi:glutamate--cysteine ligase
MTPALREDFDIHHFIDWALEFPMIFKAEGDGYRPAPPTPFRDLLRSGFEDGAAPTLADWRSHLNQIWTDVRLRSNLELRSTDGPPYWAIPAVPAFWTGLTYHRPSREAAWSLLRGYSAEQHRACMDDVIVNGLRAKLGEEPILDLARELVRLARDGMAARVAGGIEERAAMSYLTPIEEVVATGRTFADELVRRWDDEFAHDPRNYVDAFAVPC